MEQQGVDYLNAYLRGDYVVLYRRDETGAIRRSQVPAEWVVYLAAKDVEADFERDLSRSRFVRSIKREGPERQWMRVGWNDRQVRDDMVFGRRGIVTPFEQRGIATYEGDVTPVRRYLTDTGAGIQAPRRAYFDLETDSRVPFSRKEDMRILTWAVVGEDGKKQWGVLEADDTPSERRLLEDFYRAISEYDQLLAWNGDNFDFPVLTARTERARIVIDLNRWLWLDHLLLFKRMNTAAESGEEKQSMRLNDVAHALLGEGKDTFDATKTWQAWEAGGEERERLVRYNIQDTVLLRRIEEKTGSAALFDALAQVCRVFPDSRGLQPTQQMDGFMLRMGVERHIHFVTKKFRENTVEQYAGAYVMEPRANGIETDVHVCDFARLYPSVILTWNMSPETKVPMPMNGPIPEGACRTPTTRAGFSTASSGILPDGLKTLIAMRAEWNAKKKALPPGTPEWADADRRSTAYKVAANSFYGVVGSPFSRFFDRKIAESVTKTGEWLLKQTIEQAEKRGMRAIYADTDSIFVKDASRTSFEEFVRWCNEDLYPRLVAAEGCVENFIELAYEKQFRRIVFTSAKRYAGQFEHYKGAVATADSKPEVKGLEYKRGDASVLARRLQEKVIHRMIVEGENRPEEFRAAMIAERDRILHDDFPVEEVQISKGLSKPLKEYVAKKKANGEDAAAPPHVRVARVLANRGREVTEGTRIAYVVLDGDGGIHAPIPAEDYDGTFDRYHCWESLVYPPTMRVLQSAFPDSDWEAQLARIRPSKPRGGKRSADTGQLGFALAAPGVEVTVAVHEDLEPGVMERILKVVEEHPGSHPLVVRICCESGAVAVMETPHKVSGAPAFWRRIEEEFWAVRGI